MSWHIGANSTIFDALFAALEAFRFWWILMETNFSLNNNIQGRTQKFQNLLTNHFISKLTINSYLWSTPLETLYAFPSVFLETLLLSSFVTLSRNACIFFFFWISCKLPFSFNLILGNKKNYREWDCGSTTTTLFFGQKWLNWQCSVWWGVVVMQEPFLLHKIFSGGSCGKIFWIELSRNACGLHWFISSAMTISPRLLVEFSQCFHLLERLTDTQDVETNMLPFLKHGYHS